MPQAGLPVFGSGCIQVLYLVKYQPMARPITIKVRIPEPEEVDLLLSVNNCRIPNRTVSIAV